MLTYLQITGALILGALTTIIALTPFALLGMILPPGAY